MRETIRAFVAALSLAALSLATLACGEEEPGRIPPPAGPVDVTVVSPIAGAGLARYPASVASKVSADLATRASGTIRRVLVDVGDRVAAGATVAELDAGDVESRVQAARAQVERASRHFERIRSLEADGAATRQELDDARAADRSAAAALRDARAQLDYVVLRAPFRGVVTARWADPGDLAAPGRPILRIVREDSLKVVAELPADAAASLSIGTAGTASDPASGKTYDVRVVRISPAVDASSRTSRVELAFVEAPGADARLLPGAFVRLALPVGAERTTWLPARAVVRRGQLEGVFCVEGGHLRLRWIRTGERRGDDVEVLAGVTPKDSVVLAPAPDLQDGVAVASARPPEPAPTGGAGSAGGPGSSSGSEAGP